jgi:hypothetical protein
MRSARRIENGPLDSTQAIATIAKSKLFQLDRKKPVDKPRALAAAQQ